MDDPTSSTVRFRKCDIGDDDGDPSSTRADVEYSRGANSPRILDPPAEKYVSNIGHRSHPLHLAPSEGQLTSSVEVDDTASNASSRSAEVARAMKRRYSVVTAVQFSQLNRLRRIVNFQAVFGPEKVLSDLYRWITVLMVTASTILFVVNSLPQYYEPVMALDFSHWYFTSEVVMIGFFTFDFLVRVCLAESLAELRSVNTLVDFFSFFGFYVELILVKCGSTPSNTAGFALLRLLRIVRVLRLFKLSRQDSGLPMLWQVLMKSKDGLFLLVVLVGIAIIVFASILYYIETTTCTFDEIQQQWLREDGTPTPFQSIPHTFWFIAETVTTVGYGDQVPSNLGGKAWIVLVMLFGVLLLSFPNILIGSNFSDVHRELSRERARMQLGRYFRRVRVVVRFIRMWREFRIKGKILFAEDDQGRPGSPVEDGRENSFNRRGDDHMKLAKRMNFFIFRIADFPERGLIEVTAKASKGALDQVVWKKLTLIAVMQRLLECFSGCATVEEITQSFHSFHLPELHGKLPHVDDVFEVVLRGGALQVLTVFILHREDESALVQLSKKGIDMMLSFRESCTCPCMRCYAEAREIWFATTRAHAHDFLPLDGYRAWQGIESRMAKRSPLEFTYDHKLSESQLNDIFKDVNASAETPATSKWTTDAKNRCQCRYCNYLWGLSAPIRPSHDYCFQADEEFCELELEYAKNALDICKLEKSLSAMRLERLPRTPLLDSHSGGANQTSRFEDAPDSHRTSFSGGDMRGNSTLNMPIAIGSTFEECLSISLHPNALEASPTIKERGLFPTHEGVVQMNHMPSSKPISIQQQPQSVSESSDSSGGTTTHAGGAGMTASETTKVTNFSSVSTDPTTLLSARREDMMVE